MKNRDWLARAAIFAGIQRPGLPPVLISVHLKYLWKISGTRPVFTLGLFFFFFFVPPPLCAPEGWEPPCSCCVLPRDTVKPKHIYNHTTETKRKPTKQRHLRVEPGSVSCSLSYISLGLGPITSCCHSLNVQLGDLYALGAASLDQPDKPVQT